MAWLVFVLGCALSLTGAAAVTLGAAIIDLDRGSMQVIAGTIALAGGIITIALGCVLIRIESIRSTLVFEFAERARQAALVPRVVPDWPEHFKPDQTIAEPPSAEPMAAVGIPVSASTFVSVYEAPAAPHTPESEQAAGLAAIVVDAYPVVETHALHDDLKNPVAAIEHEVAPIPEPAPVLPAVFAHAPESQLADVSGDWHAPEIAAPVPVVEPEPHIVAPVEFHPADVPLEAEAPVMPAEPVLHEAHESVAPIVPPSTEPAPAEMKPLTDEPDEPDVSVVGRYNAGGVSYVMFSDGSIEATRGDERFTFQSIRELKEFIETSNAATAIT